MPVRYVTVIDHFYIIPPGELPHNSGQVVIFKFKYSGLPGDSFIDIGFGYGDTVLSFGDDRLFGGGQDGLLSAGLVGISPPRGRMNFLRKLMRCPVLLWTLIFVE